MTKIKNTLPESEIINSNIVNYSGIVPDCIEQTDSCFNYNNLTYLIGLLLNRYCETESLLGDINNIDLSCLISANPDIEIPTEINAVGLIDYYKNHFCSIYNTIESLQELLDSLKGIKCYNDIAQTDEDTSLTINVVFNDHLNTVTGSHVLTIVTPPINGTAIVSGNNIIYTPNSGFIGNEIITYKIVKGAYECEASLSIKVNQVVTEDDINQIVENQIINLLQSNEYWDISLQLGNKLIIGNDDLSYFDFSNPLTAGKGLTGTRYAKWGICNGNNGTEDLTEGTLRGFDHTNPDYLLSGQSGGSDTTSFTLNKDNIPPHKHTGGHFGIEFGAESFNNFNDNNFIPGLSDKQRDPSAIDTTGQNDGSLGGMDFYQYGWNTGDGTNNYNDNLELKSNPDSINLNIRNLYKTIIIIEKISM